MSQSNSLPAGSLLLALAVAIIWGFNFVMVKLGLEQLPPITLCALRFFLAAIPAVFFIAKPKAPRKYIVGYGLLTFALQFSLLFAGIAAGVSPGTAALISQLQVFFAIFLAWLLVKQRISRWQVSGALISFSGIAILVWHRDNNLTLSGFLLIVSAAISWGFGNLISVKLKSVNMFSLIVWSSLVAFLPLLGLAFILEEPLPILMHLEQLTINSMLALAYITYASTYFGYSCWSWLLSRYPFASISPFALLCPIIAMISSALILQETLDTWKLISGAIVIAGLCLNTFGQQLLLKTSRVFNRWQKKPTVLAEQ
jgi:O-acetylserine/cysteine efflux transporter